MTALISDLSGESHNYAGPLGSKRKIPIAIFRSNMEKIMKMLTGCYLFIFFFMFMCPLTLCHLKTDSFTEELYIKPLSKGHVYSHFHFNILWQIDAINEAKHDHYHLFPKSLGEILSKYNVRELHLSLTQGLWRHKEWGYPIEDSPPGVELWVWFHEWTREVDQSWSELTHSLSGLFCASLNFIDATNSVSPQFSFRPRGISSPEYAANSSYFLRYSALPRENTCTENLTPWKKLLPCTSKAGLATLLNSGQLFNTNYNSLSVHVRPVCRTSTCKETSLELTQTVSLVSNTIYKSRGKQDWSFEKLYGSVLEVSCPLVKSSKIYVDTTDNKTAIFHLSPAPHSVVTGIRSGEKRSYAVYNTSNSSSISSRYNTTIIHGYVPTPIIHMQRFVTGFGQESGGIRCLLRNSHYRQSYKVVYMEMVPWYFRLYLHTLKISNGLQHIKPSSLHYVPSRDRDRPALLEIAFSLPPNSVTQVSIGFERTLLKWTEYPPDANHGFYIGSAILSTKVDTAKNYTALAQDDSTIFDSFNSSQSYYFIQMHSEPLLVSLPTPDFSMPYNVICLTCTVVAIAFGPIHNLTTKRLQIGSADSGIVSKIKKKLKPFWDKYIKRIKLD